MNFSFWPFLWFAGATPESTFLGLKWLGFGIAQLKMNEPALPKKYDRYS